MSSTVMRADGVVKSPTCVSSCGSCACKKACGEPESGDGLTYAPTRHRLDIQREV